MNKKGFTLVELLAVIVILALLVGLSAGVYLNVHNNILERQYTNLIIQIETKAEEYAKDKRIINPVDISVDKLITEGYLDPDEEKYIYDPRDKENILNCYFVHVVYEDNEYNAVFNEEKPLYEDKDNIICKESNIKGSTLYIACNGDINNCNNWFKNEVTLSVVDTSETEKIEIDHIDWSNKSTGYQSSEESIVLYNNDNLVEKYSVIATVYAIDGKSYVVSKTIKMDNEVPVISDAKQSSDDWKSSKNIEFKINDGNGSGVYGYSISTNNNCPNDINGYTPDSKGKYSLPQEANTYYLCAIDNVGNVYGLNDGIVVDKIDAIAPEIKSITNPNYINGVYNWTNTPFAITIVASDNKDGSGIAYYQYTYSKTATKTGTNANSQWVTYKNSANETFTTTNFSKERNQYVYFRVCDNAGNCSSGKDYSIIKIDKKEPIVSFKSKSEGWVNEYQSIEFTIDDTAGNYRSGIYGYQLKHIGTSTKCGVASDNWSTSNAGYKKVNVKQNGNWCIYARDNAGNISSGTLVNISGIDTKKPTISVTNPMSGKWANSSYMNNNEYIVTLEGSDSADGNNPASGIVSYQYSYINNTEAIGSNPETSWVVLKETNSPKYIDTYLYNRNQEIYYRVCDDAGNCSEPGKTKIMIDVTPPTCTLWVSAKNLEVNFRSVTEEDSGWAGWEITKSETPSYTLKNNNVSLSFGTFYAYLKDNAGNTNSCSVKVFESKPDKYDKVTSTCDRSILSYNCWTNVSTSYSCPSGYSRCSSGCQCYKTGTKSATKNYCSSFTSKSSCSNASISCSWSQESGDCKGTYYTCSSGTLKYNSSGYYCSVTYTTNYNTSTYCPSGTKSGNYCYLYNQSSCGNWNIDKTNYNYYFTDSTSNVSSCSVGTGFTCNESNYNKNYVSKCTITKYKCDDGGTLLNNTYCYK